jgi:hypothetical protein
MITATPEQRRYAASAAGIWVDRWKQEAREIGRLTKLRIDRRKIARSLASAESLLTETSSALPRLMDSLIDRVDLILAKHS